MEPYIHRQFCVRYKMGHWALCSQCRNIFYKTVAR